VGGWGVKKCFLGPRQTALLSAEGKNAEKVKHVRGSFCYFQSSLYVWILLLMGMFYTMPVLQMIFEQQVYFAVNLVTTPEDAILF
jgi:hypothetical protein